MSTGLMIVEVRIRNFRCLRSVDLRLGQQTILVGENNAGKTSALHALNVALGTGARRSSDSDIYLAPTEQRAPRDRKAIIDILLRPTDDDGKLVDEFPGSGQWLAHFGNAVSQDSAGADQVVLRAELAWSSQRSEFELSRCFLTEWKQDGDEIDKVTPVVGAAVSRSVIEAISLSYIDANRDIVAEFRSGGTYWRRLVANLGLSDKLISDIEGQLDELNKKLLAGSDVLTHLETHLADLFQGATAGSHSVSIAPVQPHLRDLSRGVEALISTEGGPSFPLEAQGMGTRSLAALLTFRAFIDWRVKTLKAAALHPVVAIEEPEAHLQPQSQRAVFEQLKGLPGQWIVSTHSPYICSQGDLGDYRVFFKEGGETSVRELNPELAELDAEDVRKIRRQVLNTRGEMLFSRGLVLFEGETEEQAIPEFCARHFKKHPFVLGLTLIGVGGSGGYGPFVRLAKTFGIPWWIFSDGEDDAVSNVDTALAKLDEKPVAANPRVVKLPDGKDFESYICDEGRHESIIEALLIEEASTPQHEASLRKKWRDDDDPVSSLIEKLQNGKTRYAPLVVSALEKEEMPERLHSLFTRIANELGYVDSEPSSNAPI